MQNGHVHLINNSTSATVKNKVLNDLDVNGPDWIGLLLLGQLVAGLHLLLLHN